jgi:CelD/BcsL family acetyltransferase involved in cellulose biosynthesis
MSDPEVEEITTSAGLEALAPAWQELWERAPDATPFHAPAWLIPWWQEVGEGDLRVMAARRDGRLIALLPMYLQHGTDGGKLLPLGIAISDYLDGLFDQDCGPDVAEAILRRIADRDDWRRCELHPLRPGTPLLAAHAPPGRSDEVLAFEPCLVVEVPRQARELSDVVPSRLRGKLRYYRRRADAFGQVGFEMGTAATVSELLEALFRLHETRWQRLDQPGVLADPAIRRFHRAAAPLLLRAGLLRLHALRLDEQIVAVVYGLFAKGRLYWYLSGFDPDFGGISPGTLTVGQTMQNAIAEGAHEIDFLRGQERFKYFWGARDRPCYGRMLNRLD